MRKHIVRVLILTLFTFGLTAPARAALVDTYQVVQTQVQREARDHLRTLLAREDVAQRLKSMGVDAQQVRARVDAMSDDEVGTLAARMDALPAGGDVLGVIVILFLILLVTDILGFTDVFPFVHHPAR